MSPEVRSDVVALLVDIDWPASTPFTRMVRDNGELFTDAEAALIASAKKHEIEAGLRYMETVREFHQQQERDVRRVVELTQPYYALPGVETLGDIEPLMTAEERVELEMLCDGLAPDGYLIIRNAS